MSDLYGVDKIRLIDKLSMIDDDNIFSIISHARYSQT